MWSIVVVVVVVGILLVVLLWPIAPKSQGVAIVSMMKDPKNIKTWLQRHRKLGIQHFFIRLEESSPEIQSFLEQQSDVTLHRGESDGVNEYDNIQVRQIKWVDDALKLSSDSSKGLGWLIHIDSDEIVVGDLTQLTSQPISVRTVWFQNVEAKFKDIPNVEETCFDAARFVNCAEEPGQCAAYGNGKSAGRVAPDVSAHGPHRMKSFLESKEVKVDGILVEHYESCDFDMYKKKFKALAVQDKPSKIPFSYYNESIAAAKTGNDADLEQVYRKYRVEN